MHESVSEQRHLFLTLTMQVSCFSWTLFRAKHLESLKDLDTFCGNRKHVLHAGWLSEGAESSSPRQLAKELLSD